jgi:hypothetical protein
MAERWSALFCIGCGRVDILETCVGNCDEGPLDLVLAKEYDAVRSQIGTTVQHAGILRESLAELVAKMPEPNAPMPSNWPETHRAIQEQARSVLHQIEPSGALEEVDRIPAWRCATCGWTEAARDCLGICVRERVDFVPAEEYDDVSAEYDQAHLQVAELAAIVRQLAWVTPRSAEAEHTWESLHSRAQTAMTS